MKLEFFVLVLAVLGMLLLLILFPRPPVRVSADDIIKWAGNCEHTHLLVAIAMAESSLRPKVVHPRSGAKGLFQFMDGTVKDIRERFGYNFDPLDPQEATVAACIYLRWLLLHFDNLEHVLMAWNWGFGNTVAYLNGNATLPRETEVFIQRVKSNLNTLRSQQSLSCNSASQAVFA